MKGNTTMEHAIKKFIAATDFTFIPGENIKVHIFKVKDTDEAMMELVETGFFDGTEKIIRKTMIKDGYGDWSNVIHTIIHNDDHSYSWECSLSGATYISDKTRMEQKIINRAIETLLN